MKQNQTTRNYRAPIGVASLWCEQSFLGFDNKVE